MNSLFENLIIYDLANNHQGNVDHALNIVDQFAAIKPEDMTVAIKLQMRQLPDFIHEDFRDSKYGKRFPSHDPKQIAS